MDLFGLGKVTDNGLEVMKMVYPDVAQPGLQKVGQALGTVLDLGNTILLPLKLANANASVFFQHHMDKYRKKMEAIPEEHIGIVQPTIGLKILDELFTVTNEEIAELFINLLTNASMIERAKYAHPGFIDVIKNISEDEAKIINIYFNNHEIIFAELALVDNSFPIYLGIKESDILEEVELVFPDNSDFYLDNLEKCGIIRKEYHYIDYLLPKYEVIINRLNADKVKAEQSLASGLVIRENASIEIYKGRYLITSYGRKFIESINC
ncbi:hypothetical protein A3844_01620 [Paenibacillus helianthi]|uniref:DUF4393 domain-containing protein n=1 Tax=Paenibacillus helianthi TaxID=1349432 RepID=A0ABX3EUF1_9BACL|nr:DUF4393 domain-containing protein [Paenibacillus helianthi]OKP91838.1 hypothetical protein A3844_01620 [Paenibacillus helianthi]